MPAREETLPNKAYPTSLKYSDNSNLQEISVGGTTTKIVFDGGNGMHTGL